MSAPHLMKLSLFERALAAVSPRRAISRLRARAALGALTGTRRYDAASRSRRTAGWRASNTNANEEVLSQLPLLRARARDLARNNVWAQTAGSVITTNTIGTGIRPQPASAATGGEAAVKRTEKLLAEYFRPWAESTEIDADGRLDFYGLQELVLDTVRQSGSALVRRRIRRTSDGLTVPLQLQVLEPDHLDTSRDRELPNGGWIEGGVEFGPFGKRVAYWLFREHPGSRRSMRGGSESVRVPASDVLHVFLPDRPGQVDAPPWGVSSFITMRDLAEYNDSDLLRHKIAACMVGVVHRNDPDGALQGHDAAAKAAGAVDGGPTPLEMLEPGTFEYLEPGESVTFSTPPTAGGGPEYVTTKLREIARGFEITYESLSGDYSKVNFSSGRMGWLEMARSVHRRRAMIRRGFCEPVWGWFLEAAELVGARVQGARVRWSFPRREMLDPVKEVTAIILAIKNGLLPRGEGLRQFGFEPSDVDEEYALDIARARSLGLSFASDPGKASAAAPSTPPPGGGPEPEEEEDPEGDEENEDEDEEQEDSQSGDAA